MEKTGRPVSPHVTIYAWPTIAISSILVRLTGVALTVGAGGVGIMALGDSNAPMELANSLASSSYAPMAKFAVGFPITYHYMGAVRHAVWDLTAKGFTNQKMLSTSYALFGASALVTLGLCCTTLEPKKKEK